MSISLSLEPVHLICRKAKYSGVEYTCRILARRPNSTPPTRECSQMIEYHHCERYRPDQGFTVIVAGLTNMKPSGTFKPPRLYKVRR